MKKAVCLFVSLGAFASFACTGFYVGKKCSEDGSVILGRTVDLGALAAHKAEIVDGESCKLLLLGLEITNPSAYELAESNTNVVIVIDPASENWEGQAIL